MNYKQKRLIVIIILLFGLFSLNFSCNLFYVNNSYRLTDYNLNLSIDTGFQSPTIAESIDNAGGSSWTNMDNVLLQSDSYAYTSMKARGNSDWLRTTNFGFIIPNGAIIEGIEVQIEHLSTSFISNELSVFLVLNGIIQGDDKSTGATLPNWADGDLDYYTIYGGISDMWGTTLSEVNLESNTFGVQICYSNFLNFIGSIIYVDHIQIKIFYSEGVDDSDPPTWDSLTESDDPLELGTMEIININVYDVSTIDFVYLEFNDVNHSMNFISDNNYRYSTWSPNTIGIKTYQIHMIDEYGNINQTDDLTITVQDTTNPIINNIIESNDPLILGDIEIITCDIIDYSDIEFVYLEFEENNYSMNFISGITWNYDAWEPSIIGNYSYTIWAKDIEGNIHSVSGNITVIEEKDKTEIILIMGNMMASLFIIGFLMFLMSYLYVKINQFLPILITFLFSIVFGMTSFNVAYIPFTPYIQIFFMLYQTIFFYLKIKEKTLKNL